MTPKQTSPAYEEPQPVSLDFHPLPLLSNPHLQTFLGHMLRGRPVLQPTREVAVRLPDGDSVVLHDSSPPEWQAGEPIAVLVHGLTGSHASPMLVRAANVLLKRGLRVVRVDQRGAGKALPLSRQTYHGGRSDDLRLAMAEVHGWAPKSPLLLAGLSLGGNVVLKLAGEAANDPVPGLERVAAVAPPIDLEACVNLLSLKRNRWYERYFLKDLVTEAKLRQEYFPDLPALRLPQRLTIRQFDDLYTAPRCGFLDANDYYRRASSRPLIPRIQTPTLILTSRDDPFIDPTPFETLKVPGNITVRVLPHGGHLGFLGWDGAGGIRWAERRIVDWLLGW